MNNQYADLLAITLPGVPGSAPLARRLVRRCLERRGAPPEVVEDAVLVASELTTAAVRHRPAAGLLLEVGSSSSRIRVAVHHRGLTSHSPVGEPDPDEGRQVSLAVLAGVAEIGHSIDADGSLMWAELRLEWAVSDESV